MLIDHMIKMYLNQIEFRTKELENRISMKDAAKILDVSYWKVRQLISSGVISDYIKTNTKIKKVGPNAYMVSKKQIYELKEIDKKIWYKRAK